MITVGCDVGALFTKIVILEGDDPSASCIVRTTGSIAAEIDARIDGLLEQVGVERRQLDLVVATGSGAEAVHTADLSVDEVTCVAAAVSFYMPRVDLALQLGGQSIAAVRLDDQGEVKGVAKNDKCAAGTGRFLEMMGNKLDLEITSFDEIVAQADHPTETSDQCVVFAESEAISAINSGEPVPNILAGICSAIARIVLTQARRFEDTRCYTLTGGVARLSSVANVIEERLGKTIERFPYDPKLAAAIGAALLEETE